MTIESPTSTLQGFALQSDMSEIVAAPVPPTLPAYVALDTQVWGFFPLMFIYIALPPSSAKTISLRCRRFFRFSKLTQMALGENDVTRFGESHWTACGVHRAILVGPGAHDARRREQRGLDLLADVSWQIFEIVSHTYGLGLLIVIDEDYISAKASRWAEVEARVKGGRIFGSVDPRPVAIVVTGTDESSTHSARQTADSGSNKGRLAAQAVGQDVMDVNSAADIGCPAIGVEELDLPRKYGASAAKGGS